jgi:hypothetical protein
MKKIKGIELFILSTLLILLLLSCKNSTDTTSTSTTVETTTTTQERDPLTYPKNGWFSHDFKVKFVRKVAQITGEESINKTFSKYGFGRIKDGLFGTDLGIPVYDGEKMYLFFGDTLDEGVWESNSLGFSTDFYLDDGLKIDSFLVNNWRKVKAVIQGKHDADVADGVEGRTATDGREVTKIPTGGIAIGDAVYMHFMSIREWTHWYVNYNGVVKSTDGGKTWNLVPSLQWTENDAPNFGQIFPIEDKDNPDLVYIYGIPGGRSGAMKLARVLKVNYEDMSQYEYYNGLDESNNPIWLKGTAGLAAIKDNPDSIIIPSPVGESSIMYNEYLGKWFFTTLNGSLVFRTSDQPWGPWSNENVIVAPSDFNAGIYGAFVHEQYTTHNGQRIFFVMSLWEPYYDTFLMEMVLR